MPDPPMDPSFQEVYIPEPPMEPTNAQIWERMNSLWLDNKAWKDRAGIDFAELRAQNATMMGQMS